MIRTFTSESNYIDFCRDNDILIDSVLSFKESILNYANIHGISLEDENLEIDSSFSNYIENQHLAIFGVGMGVNLFKVWDDVAPYGTDAILSSSTPRLIG